MKKTTKKKKATPKKKAPEKVTVAGVKLEYTGIKLAVKEGGSGTFLHFPTEDDVDYSLYHEKEPDEYNDPICFSDASEFLRFAGHVAKLARAVREYEGVDLGDDEPWTTGPVKSPHLDPELYDEDEDIF